MCEEEKTQWSYTTTFNIFVHIAIVKQNNHPKRCLFFVCEPFADRINLIPCPTKLICCFLVYYFDPSRESVFSSQVRFTNQKKHKSPQYQSQCTS